ncbi:MAG: MoxR family ATPase [Pseudomonadota bacterium]
MNDEAPSELPAEVQEAEPRHDEFAQHAERIASVRAAIGKAFIGQQEVIDQVLIALFAGGHVLLEGVPGLGKTLLVRALAQSFNGNFARIQFTPDLMPSDVSGHALYDPRREEFRIRRGPVFTNLLLADEINRAPAKTQAALLEVMQELQVTIEGKSFALPPPFMTVATQNPIEHEGTYPLPEAQLDRFLFNVRIDYPQHDTETALVTSVVRGQVGESLNVSSVPQVMTAKDLLAAQQAVSRITVDERVIDYAVRIAAATRDWPGLSVGAGPRGSIAMIRAARASALIAGRDFCVPDDVREVALPTLRHRIILAPELEIEAYRPDDIIGEVLKKVDAPRE